MTRWWVENREGSLGYPQRPEPQFQLYYLRRGEISGIEIFLHWIHRTCEQQGSQKKGAHTYAYSSVSFPNVSVSSVIENCSYDLPYVKNFNTRNDSSSLIKDYKCNKIKSTKLKLSIILLWSPWKYRCGQRTVRLAVVACSQKQRSLRAQAHQSKSRTETCELVKVKQNFKH
ncbi:hypothetical protein TNCV_2897021 [Trichonephila clavipes]|nr:hypothetical protein TNCV_2897021 [Trichonephila clavipes]